MISIKNKIENISEKIQDINDILNSFLDYEQIPNIDIDLLKDKLRKVYDDINTINKIELTVKSVNNNVVVEDSFTEEEFKIENEFKKTEPDTALQQANIEDKKESFEKIISNEEKTVNEKLDLLANSDVKDIIAEFKNSKDLASHLQFKPIDDINKAVSLNDKIGFINDIFAGDTDLYSNCISKLNNASNLSNAVNILEENQKLDKENPVHKKFVEFVFRKFAK